MKRIVFKRTIAALASAALMLTSFGLPNTAMVIYANEELPEQEQTETLAAVTDLRWVADSSATVSWTGVDDANYYAVTVTVYESDGSTLIGSTVTGTTATELDVQQEIHNVIGEAEYDTVKVAATVVAQNKQDDVVIAQSLGITSDLWKYIVKITRLPTPTDLCLSDGGILTFCYDGDISEVYEFSLYYSIDFSSCLNYSSRNLSGIMPVGNNMYSIDTSSKLPEIYSNALALKLCSPGDGILISISIAAHPKSHDVYIDSLRSEESNAIDYISILRTSVESLTLSPSAPKICKGKSYFLGKTVSPEDAYYENIEWSSDADDIVTVDKNGQITGVAAGIANVTAVVGEVTSTVPVTVYEISTNVVDETAGDEITDTAGSIVDDIVNNDDPDISNTDISKDDLDDIKEDITDAIDNGDEIWVNFKDLGRGLGHYKEYWNDPAFWEWYRSKYGDNNGWHLGWGCDVVYEIGYTDSDGNDHHIGNITEFDKEYEFEFIIPDDAEIEELKNGKKRIYNVIRVHDGQYEIVDIEIDKHGKIKVKSDKYSDFILLYKDIDNSRLKPTATPGDGKVTLTWNAVSDAEKYAAFFVDPEGTTKCLASKLTNLTYTAKNLTNGTTYKFYVRACVDGKWTKLSDVEMVECTPVSGRPVVETVAGDTQVTLTWNAIEGATKYAAYCVDPDGNTKTLYSKITDTTYIAKKLTNGTTYKFYVRAYADGKWTKFTPEDMVECTPVSPKPVIIEATAGDGEVTFNWTAVDGAVKYAAYVVDPDGNTKTLNSKLIDLTYTAKKLTNGTTYKFYVRAYANGKWTKFTPEDMVECTPIAPKPVVTATPGDKQVTLTWNAVTGAEKYAAYIVNDDGSLKLLASKITDTEYIAKKLTNGKKYRFVVRAYIDGKWTKYNNYDIVSATPNASQVFGTIVTSGCLGGRELSLSVNDNGNGALIQNPELLAGVGTPYEIDDLIINDLNFVGQNGHYKFSRVTLNIIGSKGYSEPQTYCYEFENYRDETCTYRVYDGSGNYWRLVSYPANTAPLGGLDISQFTEVTSVSINIETKNSGLDKDAYTNWVNYDRASDKTGNFCNKLFTSSAANLGVLRAVNEVISGYTYVTVQVNASSGLTAAVKPEVSVLPHGQWIDIIWSIVPDSTGYEVWSYDAENDLTSKINSDLIYNCKVSEYESKNTWIIDSNALNEGKKIFVRTYFGENYIDSDAVSITPYSTTPGFVGTISSKGCLGGREMSLFAGDDGNGILVQNPELSAGIGTPHTEDRFIITDSNFTGNNGKVKFSRVTLNITGKKGYSESKTYSYDFRNFTDPECQNQVWDGSGYYWALTSYPAGTAPLNGLDISQFTEITEISIDVETKTDVFSQYTYDYWRDFDYADASACIKQFDSDYSSNIGVMRAINDCFAWYCGATLKITDKCSYIIPSTSELIKPEVTTEVGNGHAALKWKTSGIRNLYEIYRCDRDKNELIYTITSSDQNNNDSPYGIIISNLTNGTTYRYFVRSYQYSRDSGFDRNIYIDSDIVSVTPGASTKPYGTVSTKGNLGGLELNLLAVDNGNGSLVQNPDLAPGIGTPMDKDTFVVNDLNFSGNNGNIKFSKVTLYLTGVKGRTSSKTYSYEFENYADEDCTIRKYDGSGHYWQLTSYPAGTAPLGGLDISQFKEVTQMYIEVETKNTDVDKCGYNNWRNWDYADAHNTFCIKQFTSSAANTGIMGAINNCFSWYCGTILEVTSKAVNNPSDILITKPVVTATPGDKQVTLTWDVIEGAERYAAYIVNDDESTTLLTSKITDTTYIAKKLTNGTTYRFVVRAYVNGKWTKFTNDDIVSATPNAQ